MKKILLMMFALLVVGGAKVYAGLVPGNEFTSVAALDGKVFAIVNKTEGKAICNKKAGNDYDLQYLPYAEAFSADVTAYLFKIEQIDDSEDANADGKYLIRSVKENGSNYTFYGWATTYFQSNTTGSGVCFFFDLNFAGHKRGADADNTGAWDIQYDAVNGGFTLKNIGTNKYYNDPTKDAMSDTPAYFTFCEVDIVEDEPVASTTYDEWYSGGLTFKANDYVGGELQAIANTRWVKDVTNVENNCIVVTSNDTPATAWDSQFFISLGEDHALSLGDKFTLSMKIRAKKAATAQSQVHKQPGAYLGYMCVGDISFSREWSTFTKTVEVTKNDGGDWPYTMDGMYTIALNLSTAETANNYYFDDISVTIAKKITMGEAGTRTYSFNQALDFTDVEGLEAYAITAFTPATNTLTLTKVTKVPANTGLYLVGAAGDYLVPSIASADAIAGNLLHASSGSVALEPTDGSNTNLIFGGTGADRGFYKLSESGIIGANKAYLQVLTADYNTAMSSSAPLRFVIEDEDATGIAEVKTVENTDDAWYTLNGVKLNGQPTEKGIYVNNGKKVVIK